MRPHFIWKGDVTQAQHKIGDYGMKLGLYTEWTYFFTGLTFGKWGFGILQQKNVKRPTMIPDAITEIAQVLA